MQTAEAARLFDYVYWMRDRILAATSNLTPEQFRSSETVATRDLRATLVHELDVESSWRERLSNAPEAGAASVELAPDDFASLEALEARWRQEESVMRAWLSSLSDDTLAAPPVGQPPDLPRPLPLSDYLTHLVGHAVEEFTEAALLLTRLGHSPDGIEFLKYANRPGS
ncbi:MAG: DinB family protein [Chloroflexi bacterium]|nr:DinB family protein [Chloroflexota bacterium]